MTIQTSPETMTDLRAQLVRIAIAHTKRGEAACAALPAKGETEPPWLLDAWHGSSMAGLYAQVLASVLRDVEEELPAEKVEDIRSSVAFMLENGTEDENADVWPEDVQGSDA